MESRLRVRRRVLRMVEVDRMVMVLVQKVLRMVAVGRMVHLMERGCRCRLVLELRMVLDRLVLERRMVKWRRRSDVEGRARVGVRMARQRKVLLVRWTEHQKEHQKEPEQSLRHSNRPSVH